jgi:hypothetical protein
LRRAFAVVERHHVGGLQDKEDKGTPYLIIVPWLYGKLLNLNDFQGVK